MRKVKDWLYSHSPFIILVFGLMLVPFLAKSQINVVPQVGLNTANLRQNTYSAAIKNLVPAALSTDFFCINGSATKTVRINRIELSGTATTMSNFVVLLNHNSALDTGTKAVAATYGPIPYPLLSTEPAATAATVAYNTTGGVPTIGGTATTIRTGQINLNLTIPTIGIYDRLVWIFGSEDEFYNQALAIPPLATPVEQYCLNLNGVTVSGGVLQGYIEWTEQ